MKWQKSGWKFSCKVFPNISLTLTCCCNFSQVSICQFQSSKPPEKVHNLGLSSIFSLQFAQHGFCCFHIFNFFFQPPIPQDPISQFSSVYMFPLHFCFFSILLYFFYFSRYIRLSYFIFLGFTLFSCNFPFL